MKFLLSRQAQGTLDQLWDYYFDEIEIVDRLAVSKTHIRKLMEHFGVTADTFL